MGLSLAKRMGGLVRYILAKKLLSFSSYLSLILLCLAACNGAKTDKSTANPNSNSARSSLGQYYKDADGDGFGDPHQAQEAMNPPEGFVSNNIDCNDQNKKVNPRSEISENTNPMLDFNCDGVYSWLPQKVYIDQSTPGFRPYLCEEKFIAEERKKIELCHRDESPSSEIVTSVENIYDEKGNVLFFKTRAGDLSSPVTFSIEYTYDEHGNMLTQKNHLHGDLSSPVTSSTKISYRSPGKRLFYEVHEGGDLNTPINFSIEYFYNDQGNEISRKMTSDAGRIVISFPVETVYDPMGNELSFKEYRNGPAPIPPTFSREYHYDALGNRISEKTHNGGDLSDPVTSSVEFDYDAKGNILLYKEHHHGDLSSPVNFVRQYSYDEKGNRLSFKEHRGGDLTSPVTKSWAARSEDYQPIRVSLSGDIYGH